MSTDRIEINFDKFCPECGKGLSNDAKFCSGCGKKLKTENLVSPYLNAENTLMEKKNDQSVTIRDRYLKNGIVYKIIDTINGCEHYTTTTAEYNEVLVYYTFLSLYDIIKRPDLLNEDDYNCFDFSSIGVNAVKKVHTELVSKGFYTNAHSADVLSTYKVYEIKEIAAKLNISVKGKKEELISQVVSQANECDLLYLLGDSYLSISPLGEKWMTDHEEEYNYYTSEKEFASFEDYISYWKIHDHKTEAKKDCINAIKHDKESFGRYKYDALISLLEEDGNYKEATLCYLKELMIEVSGALNYADWKACNFEKDFIKECNNIVFPPFLIKQFPEHKQYYEPSMIMEAYSIKLPIVACSIEDFQDIAEMMFDGTMDEDTRKMYSIRLSNQLVAKKNGMR